MRGKKLLALLLVVCMSVLAGCTSRDIKNASAAARYQEYIKAVMECSYYGEMKNYMEVCDASESEAEEVYNNTVEYYAYELMSFNGIDITYISDEMYDSYVELAREIMSKVSFTVNEGVEVNDEWQVKIEINPIDLNDITYDDIEDCIDDYNNLVSDVDTSAITNEQLLEWEENYAQAVYDVISSYVPSMGYKDTVSKVVIITVDDDGLYGITNDDWNDIDDIVVDMKY